MELFGKLANAMRPRLFPDAMRPRLFPDAKGTAWLKHNVEEVGNLEHFLPELYASSVDSNRSRSPAIA